ncbi:MAG: ABC transporter ATP-binding protein [Sphaerobacteraceae bacterium]|nr:MAG: ABC transporter ATP-binding protein [Sphaerobacteraceae bacterium]
MTQSDNPTLINATSLSKHYGKTVALDQISVELPHASIGLLGPNGAGKSTFLKLMLGLSAQTSGDLMVFGRDVQENPMEIRRRIGYMPESDCLAMDTTAFDFVRHMGEVSGLPSNDARLRAADMLYLCGLDEERYRMIREFSTGMKQRVKLAQALVHDPDLVFLDEPTNGLDPSGHDEMLTLIRRIHDELGIAVVLSSHVLEDIERVCDYVMMIDSGRLVGAGYLSDLMDTRQEITLELDGDVESFSEGVRRRGFEVSGKNGMLAVVYQDDAVFDAIRDAAVDSGVAMRTLVTRRTSLEEFYIDVVEQHQADQEPV